MPQTMLAFLAMIIVGTHALNTQRYEILVQHRDVTRELEEMAGSIALETMEIIRTRAWDESVLNGSATGSPSDLDVMKILPFGGQSDTHNDCTVFGGSDVCDDINDFNDMKSAIRPFVMGLDTLWFSVDISVQYVESDLSPSSAVTQNKEVTVKVLDYWPNGAYSYFSQPVALSRVFSYEF